MKEILPGIWTWSWFSDLKGYDFNGYLLELDGGNLCLDPVEMDNADLDAIADKGVSRILITNRNHTRAAKRITERTGAGIFIHPDDEAHATEQGVTIAGHIQVGEEIGPLQVVSAAGKSPGEVAFVWPERKLLFVGDVFVGNPPGQFAVLPDKVVDDPDQLRETIRRIAADVEFDAVLPGDGVPVLEGAKAQLVELIGSF